MQQLNIFLNYSELIKQIEKISKDLKKILKFFDYSENQH